MVLQLDLIDTKEQAQIFANQIAASPQIYFLDGKWGSGKSEYLKQVESCLPRGFKFVELVLWKPKDKSSLAKKLFAATNPFLSSFFTLIGWLLIGIMVCGSVILSLKSVIPMNNMQNIPLLITAIAVIVTTLYGFLQNKWLDVDRLRMTLSSLTLRSRRCHRVLVVDDFDRLDEALQSELYLLFNSIRKPSSGSFCFPQEQARVIFVGDLGKLKNIEDNYLSKIIDQKISLPFQLHSRNIAHLVADQLLSKFDCNCAIVERLFTEEKHTARDANQFLCYVQREMINREKSEKVQADQQLFVIYLYLFHPDKYQMLLDGWLPEAPENMALTPETGEGGEQSESLVMNFMRSVFQPRETNPPDFRKNMSAYLVNELATNRSPIELREVIDSDSKELDEMLHVQAPAKSLRFDEFYDFVQCMRDEEYQAVQEQLEHAAISVMKSEVRYRPNRLIKLIFEKRLEMLLNRDRDIQNQELLTEFDKVFDVFGDIGSTERMYYYRSCLNLYGKMSYESNFVLRSIPAINEENVCKYFLGIAKTIENGENFGQKNYDAEALIVQLGYRYYLDGPVNPKVTANFESKVESIEKLKPREYQDFWETYDIQPVKNESTIILAGGAALVFDYRGKSYDQHVLKRLRRDSDKENKSLGCNK